MPAEVSEHTTFTLHTVNSMALSAPQEIALCIEQVCCALQSDDQSAPAHAVLKELVSRDLERLYSPAQRFPKLKASSSKVVIITKRPAAFLVATVTAEHACVLQGVQGVLWDEELQQFTLIHGQYFRLYNILKSKEVDDDVLDHLRQYDMAHSSEDMAHSSEHGIDLSGYLEPITAVFTQAQAVAVPSQEHQRQLERLLGQYQEEFYGQDIDFDGDFEFCGEDDPVLKAQQKLSLDNRVVSVHDDVVTGRVSDVRVGNEQYRTLALQMFSKVGCGMHGRGPRTLEISRRWLTLVMLAGI